MRERERERECLEGKNWGSERGERATTGLKFAPFIWRERERERERESGDMTLFALLSATNVSFV